MESIEKLSDLRAGILYRVHADEVEATLQVVTAGEMPVCLVQGQVKEYLDDTDNDGGGIMVVQLIGWSRCGGVINTITGLNLFDLNKKATPMSWLAGMRLRDDGVPELMLMALDPTIEEFTATEE